LKASLRRYSSTPASAAISPSTSPRVSIRTGDEEIRVAGTTIGSENRQWLVSALGFDLDLELAPLLVLVRYDDVPGVIGRVGTLFGDAGVNIANMTVSRSRRGGKALMVLSVDSPPPSDLVERIHRDVDFRVTEAAILVGANLLTHVKHRRLVTLALSDHDLAVDGERVHFLPHRLDRDLV
jgi:hypothetical protein